MNDFLLCILDRETNRVRRRHGSGTKCETERTGAPLSVQLLFRVGALVFIPRRLSRDSELPRDKLH